MSKQISMLFFLGTTLSHVGAMNLPGDSYLERTIAGDDRRVELQQAVEECAELLASLDARIEEADEGVRRGLLQDRPILVERYAQVVKELEGHTFIGLLSSAAPLAPRVVRSPEEIKLIARRRQLSNALRSKERELTRLSKAPVSPTSLVLAGEIEAEQDAIVAELESVERELQALRH